MTERDASYMLPEESVLYPPVHAFGFDEVGSGKTMSVDVVIVGSGPGGASAARVLAEAGASVLVIEEGPASSRFKRSYAHTARHHMQEGGTIVARGSAMMPIAAGRGVGGGTLINSALSFTAPDHVLNKWAEMLDTPALSAAELAPVYAEMATIIGVGTTPDVIAGENNRLIVRGIDALGLDGGLAPRSTPGCVGCGVCYFGCPTSGKASTNLTFLPRAHSNGARIQAETRVVDVLVEGNRAVGVRGVAIHPDTGEQGGELIVHADTVMLSAGAIGTPRLLWSCGLAKRLGAVGEGLHVHPGSTVIARCDHPVYMWRGATQGAYFHHPDLPGVLPHTFSAPPEACLVAAGLIGSRFQEGLAMLPNLCGLLVMISDRGAGRVRAFSDGRANITYHFHPDDVSLIKRSMVEVARVLQAGGAKELYVPVHGVASCQTPEELGAALADRALDDFTLYAAHPMSTCRMSTLVENGPIDSQGRAHRLENLLIADASVFPSSLGVNPQLSTMVMGTYVARELLKRQ